ncbi:MAG: response regulator [Pyrinomonadaceae bacterium]
MSSFILVADDSKQWRELLSKILSGASYQVVEAESGERAVEVARAASPDLVLLDLNMPHLSGLDTAGRLRAIPGLELVPILLLSDDELDGDCDSAPAPNIDGYVRKKDIPDRLLDCISLHLK